MENVLFRLLFFAVLISVFNCQPKQIEEKDRGFLRVDNNGRYFVFDDGTSYIPVGFNKTIDSLGTTDDPEDNFEAISTRINLDPGLTNPPYTIDWIDIRSGKVIKKETIESFPASIAVPPFNDGIFAHLNK